jgi:hypothetical protein
MTERARGLVPALLALSVVLLVSCATLGVAAGTPTDVEQRGADGLLMQQAGPNGTNGTNATGGGPAGNGTATNGTNASGGGGGGGGLFGGFDVDIPDPVDMLEDMIGAFADGLLGVPESFVSAFNGFVFNLPAPGEAGDPSTWTSPSNGIWPGVVDAIGYTLALAIPLWGLALVRAFATGDERERRASFKRCGYAGAMILLGLPLAGAALHVTNGAITGLAPDAEAFFSTPEGVAQLGVGVFAGVVLGLTQMGVIAVSLIVLALERVLVYVTVFLWPLAWAARAYDGLAKSLGETVTYLFGVVIALKLGQALIVRLVFEVGLTGGGAGGVLIRTMLTVGALLFAFIILPKNMLNHANDAASVSLGMSAATSQGKEYADRSAERVRGVATEGYRSFRGRDESGGVAGGDDRTTVGSVGSTTSSSSSSGDRASAGDATSNRRPAGESAGGHSRDDDVGDGLDADDWAKRRERMRYDDDRGFQ